MVKMLCGIGGITALGDWIQLTLKPEKMIEVGDDMQVAINDIVSGKKTGYLRDDWNISTRVIVDIQIVQTWKPLKDAPDGHVFEKDNREVE